MQLFWNMLFSAVSASQCRNHKCREKGCYKTKRVIHHNQQWKRNPPGGCPKCQHLYNYSNSHAKLYSMVKFSVPFCASIRLEEQQQQKYHWPLPSDIQWSSELGYVPFLLISLDQTATQVPTRMEKSVDVDPLETDGKKIVHDEKLKEISKNELSLRH